MCLFSLEVTGNVNLLRNAQHQKATSSKNMANLHAPWLKISNYTLVNLYNFMEGSNEANIRDKRMPAFKDILTI